MIKYCASHPELVRHVQRRVKELKLTPYQLHRNLNGRVGKQTVYNFVEHGRVIHSTTLLVILGELGLAIRLVPKRKTP